MSVPLTIVIPCYNESNRLQPGLSAALRWFEQNLPAGSEIILVDDGSTDRTREVLSAAASEFPGLAVEVASYTPNQGKGWAVRTGMMAARGEKVVMMDADFSIDLPETLKFVAALDEADAAIGTKKHLLTQSVRRQGATRRFLGKGFTALTNILLRMHFTDITCGMKAFRREAAQRLFSRQRLHRWSYDSEILFLAKRLGYRVVEIPVRWAHVEGSKVSEFRDVLHSFRDLMAILANYYLGRYKT